MRLRPPLVLERILERVRWGVWESPAYDGHIAREHDDLLVSAALCTVLDAQRGMKTGSTALFRRSDPLDEIEGGGWG